MTINMIITEMKLTIFIKIKEFDDSNIIQVKVNSLAYIKFNQRKRYVSKKMFSVILIL